jgi:hypothetical protein
MHNPSCLPLWDSAHPISLHLQLDVRELPVGAKGILLHIHLITSRHRGRVVGERDSKLCLMSETTRNLMGNLSLSIACPLSREMIGSVESYGV